MLDPAALAEVAALVGGSAVPGIDVEAALAAAQSPRAPFNGIKRNYPDLSDSIALAAR